MVDSQQQTRPAVRCSAAIVDWFRNLNYIPMSPKNLRISVILISIYQVLIAHIVLFMMLLCLAHAEEMRTILGVDIADQKEREDYYEMPYNAKGESLNQVRFQSATKLASLTLVLLYVATAIATIYLFTCLSLLIGTLRSRSELMLPWLVLDLVSGCVIFACMIVAYNQDIYTYLGGKFQYWLLCGGLTLLDLVIWFVVHAFYVNLRHMKNLTEVATVPIPWPAPGAVPFYYRKENMYLGSGGYKHILSEAVNQNYVV